MTAPLPAPSIADVEGALDALLSALIEQREQREAEADPAGTFEIITFSELMSTPSEVWKCRDFVADPIGRSLRRGIKEAGRHLYRLLGSTTAMGDVLERVAERNPRQYGRRASIIDHAWNGIGESDDRWWC